MVVVVVLAMGTMMVGGEWGMVGTEGTPGTQTPTPTPSTRGTLTTAASQTPPPPGHTPRHMTTIMAQVISGGMDECRPLLIRPLLGLVKVSFKGGVVLLGNSNAEVTNFRDLTTTGLSVVSNGLVKHSCSKPWSLSLSASGISLSSCLL